MEDRRNVGGSSCNCGDGTDQRVQSLMFMMMTINCKSKGSEPQDGVLSTHASFSGCPVFEFRSRDRPPCLRFHCLLTVISIESQMQGIWHFAPGENTVPILQEAVWAPRASLDGRKISSPLGFDPGPSSP